MMQTVADLLTRVIPQLVEAGVDSPRLDAELLLAHVLGVTRTRLWSYPETPVSEEQAAAMQRLLERRVRREPLAYLLGEWEFYGRTFHVSAAVLIPRPETELLVEAVVQWAQAHAARELIDVGTGSGAIAVTLAAELPAAQVTALDLSPTALEVAQRNAQRHGVSERMRWYTGDLLHPLLGMAATCDAVVANLPYIAQAEIDRLMPEVRDYEPRLALQAEDEGLALIRRLIVESPTVLRPGGLIALEVGQGQADTVAAFLAAQGWQAPWIITDYAGIPRHVLATAP
ncbi:MAG TPA: peptide chain release factor N(5)-glutamine methyltransferase [Armatimonadota bacterium]|jgi:release factor glutamine methyltransferase